MPVACRTRARRATLIRTWSRRPGQRKMVQPDGMDLDRALQMAPGAGYFYDVADPSQLTTSDLLDEIAEDLQARSGSPMNENAKASEELRLAAALDEYLRQLGGDVATMDNATLKALIMKGWRRTLGSSTTSRLMARKSRRPR